MDLISFIKFIYDSVFGNKRMGFADIIVIFLFTFYSLYCLKLIIPSTRIGIQKTNKKLHTIRNKTYKTLDEQKKFLELKYPKTIGTFKFKWMMIPNFLVQLLLVIIMFRSYMLLFTYFNITVQLWQAILFIIFFPMLINLVLEKFNVQKGDLKYLLRW